jgi:hypothetical protein
LFLLAAVLIVAGYVLAVQPYMLTWGSTAAERAMPIPGDADIPPHSVVTTRAVTIHAPPEEIWPWIAMIGQGRGGFYSFDWLENLFAANMHNAEQIDPALQGVAVGDRLSFQQDGPSMLVTLVEPGRALSCAGWTWHLVPVAENTTRLVVRYSFPVPNAASAAFYYPVFEPAHFIMEAGMMLGIKERAERSLEVAG